MVRLSLLLRRSLRRLVLRHVPLINPEQRLHEPVESRRLVRLLLHGRGRCGIPHGWMIHLSRIAQNLVDRACRVPEPCSAIMREVDPGSESNHPTVVPAECASRATTSRPGRASLPLRMRLSVSLATPTSSAIAVFPASLARETQAVAPVGGVFRLRLHRSVGPSRERPERQRKQRCRSLIALDLQLNPGGDRFVEVRGCLGDGFQGLDPYRREQQHLDQPADPYSFLGIGDRAH